MADILIGLGGTGGKILKAFRQRLWTEFDAAQRRNLPLGFIYVDSDRAMLDASDISYQTIHGNCVFETNDFVDIKTHSNIDAIFANPKGYPRLTGILGNVGATQSAVCPVGAAADQKRRAGRLLFASNIEAYLSKLATAVQDVQQKEVGSTINVHIFCGLAGGTGSGSIVDAIAQTRKWMFEHNIAEKTGFTLTVFCQIPEANPQPNWDNGRYKANGYGALLELNNLFASHYNMEWGTRVTTPPYDVSTTVETGRLYLTYANPTPDNVKKGAIPQELNIAGGLILYTNRNDFGYTVNDPLQLAGLVADFVYSRIFSTMDQMGQELGRFYTFENLSNNRDEYDETADPDEGSPLPVRTRAIGSFGIKRIIVPETELQEHIAYTLGSSALLQMKYNNWSNTSGYREEAPSFDEVTYVRDPGRRGSWKLTPDHMRLKQYVIDSDEKEKWPVGDFANYWNPCVDRWAEAAKGTQHPFDKLVDLCRGGYAEGFRGVGVEKFYRDKARSLDTYAKQIAEGVEKYLFREWADGRLALVSVRHVVAELAKQMREQALECSEVVVPDLDTKINEFKGIINQAKEDVLNTNIVKRQIIFGNRFERATHYAKLLYSAMTERAAVDIFAKPLLENLEQRFNDLNTRLVGFESSIDKLFKFAKARMTALADLETVAEGENRDGTETLTEPIVKFYSRNRMKDLEHRLNGDHDRMTTITESVRSALVDALSSEGRFANVVNLTENVLSGAFLGPVFETIKTFHNDLCVERTEKVLDVPILERLQHKFGGNDMALTKFAQDIIQASGAFLEINQNEILLNNANTAAPEVGKNILIKRVLVTLPKAKDPALIQFADDLKRKLQGAIPGGAGASVVVSTEGARPNEITVMIVENCFPMRAIGSLPMLKAEFDRLIAANPANSIVLTSEGKAEDYRELFARPPKTPDQLRAEVMPYMMLALGLGAIQFDSSTSEQWGAAGEPDIFGNSTIVPWGYSKFTEMAYDDRLIENHAKEIMRIAREALAARLEDVDPAALKAIQDKLKEADTEFMGVVGKVMKDENPTPKSRYNDFVAWTMAAKELIKEYRPER